MSEYFPIRGICLGCQSGTGCDVHQSRAMLECGSFRSLDGRVIDYTVREAPHYTVSRAYIGLCHDCEIRAFCENAFRTGGKWTCDQYR